MTRHVLVTELMKLRRSAAPWATLVGILLAPLGIALFMWIIRDPQRAASLGLLGTKANLVGLEATWPAYGGYLGLVVGAGGMLVLAFVVAFLFGREYADGTARNMLALPVDRAWFALGKLTVAAIWWSALTLAGLAEGFVVGWAIGLPGFSPAVATSTLTGALVAAGASYLLCPVVAWVTVATRNYLAALGFALGMLLLGDVVGHTGWAPWFPWSLVPLLTGMTETPAPVHPASYVVLGLTFLAGTAATVLQLRFADIP